MVQRTLRAAVARRRAQYPILTLTGPRQSGKTTLCRDACPELAYANLEAPDTRQFAEDDPRGFLAQFEGGAVLDEIQRVPDLLSYLQVMVDEDPTPGRFVLTGSHQLLLDANVSQTLAGRTALLRLLPLSLAEARAFGRSWTTNEALFRGGYPRIYDRDLEPTEMLGDYLATYVERDVRQLSQIRDLSLFRRFVQLCAGRIGFPLNRNGLASDLGISQSTASEWIRLLEASFVVVLVPPWHGNIGKRLIKSPKLYFGDVGLACFLLGIEKPDQIATHPLRGALFENLVVLEMLKARWHRGRPADLTFFRDSTGFEVDAVLTAGDGVTLLEAKAAATVNTRFFSGIDKLAGLLTEPVRRRVLVYDGDTTGPRSNCEVVNLRDLEATLVGDDD
ncbi:MAG: ATP-binding protein [Planctomycetes bacterium]|nr:ATP-binding protein [Planctomycetota bacterium]